MPPKLEPYLRQKRDELIWSLSDPKTQGYSMGQIARMFNDMPKSTVQDIINRRPEGWESPWSKIK
jgi:hypothetical protein